MTPRQHATVWNKAADKCRVTAEREVNIRRKRQLAAIAVGFSYVGFSYNEFADEERDKTNPV